MLARANRVVSAADYKTTVRRGRRTSTPHTLVYVAPRGDAPTRFGFIVSKTVGNSVTRNLVTRRFRAIGREALQLHPVGHDVVIRALPGSPEVSWSNLRGEVLNALGERAIENKAAEPSVRGDEAGKR
ncbi:MAG TPA: ribonuclease P protein component [Galbitalea sp.]